MSDTIKLPSPITKRLQRIASEVDATILIIPHDINIKPKAFSVADEIPLEGHIGEVSLIQVIRRAFTIRLDRVSNKLTGATLK